MTSNAVKSAAASGTLVRGVHLTFPAPSIVEILTAARLDFVYLDGEHGNFDIVYLGKDGQSGGDGVNADYGNWQ